MSQNIYDNALFFKEYAKLRQELNYNYLLEQPAIWSCMPEIAGKNILDIGCGFGASSKKFIESGAASVIAIDVSKKMLNVAKKMNAHEKIEYILLVMEDLEKIHGTFDIIYSSLSFHYVKDFAKLIDTISHLLEKGGFIVFSQEHPIVTATIDCKGHHNLDEDGNFSSYTFADYSNSGKRVGFWFVDHVVNYHRPLGEIITTIAQNDLCITNVIEPLPSNEAITLKPDLIKEFIKPTFLIITAKKI